MNKPITIDYKTFQQGIASSSILGNQNMRNCDIWTDEGVIKADFQLNNEKDNELSLTFTADAGTDLITASSTMVRNFSGEQYSFIGRAVTFTTTGTLPAPLVAGTVYFLSTASGNQTTQARVATTLALANAGTPDVDITDSGSGTHTIATVNMSLVKHYIDSDGIISGYSIFCLDDNGRVWGKSSSFWYLITGNTTGSGRGQGLGLWKNYLFVFGFTAIDVCGNGTSTGITSSNWTVNWQTSIGSATGLAEHKTFLASNDILYFANNYSIFDSYVDVGSISEVAGATFAPGTPATYTFNTSALDLPDYHNINDFEEFNGNLMIATDKTEIYPWDMVSDSVGDPILSPESGVQVLKVFNNVMYFSSGVRGNMYKTLGTTAMKVIEFSDEVSGLPQNTLYIYDIAIYQGYLIFVVNMSQNVSTTPSYSGVYMFNPETGTYWLKNRSTLGYGSFGANNVLGRLFSIPTSNLSYYVSARLGPSTNNSATLETTSGVYSPQRQQTYAVLTTERFKTGTFQQPRTFEKCELVLKNPLNTGESVVITFTANSVTGTLTTTNTFSYASMNGKETESQILNLQNVYEVQLSIQINPTTTSGVNGLYATPEIREIIIT